jgi:GR25 family glycosyltransferase involved in LPS biosynthesis
MKIQEFVDEAYYINLDYRTDRREFMETQLKSLGLYDFIKRIPGVDVFGKTEYIVEDHNKMFLAGQACSFAHRNAIKKAKENGSKNVLVLEDDALFYNCDEYNGLDIIESALDDLSKINNWEIYFLGSTIYDKELDLRAPNLIKCECCVSLQGYVVNHTCFDKIIDNKYDKPFDVMDIFINNNFKEKYITYPAALTQCGNNISDIGGHTTMSIDFWLDFFNKPVIKNY